MSKVKVIIELEYNSAETTSQEVFNNTVDIIQDNFGKTTANGAVFNYENV